MDSCTTESLRAPCTIIMNATELTAARADMSFACLLLELSSRSVAAVAAAAAAVAAAAAAAATNLGKSAVAAMCCEQKPTCPEWASLYFNTAGATWSINWSTTQPSRRP